MYDEFDKKLKSGLDADLFISITKIKIYKLENASRRRLIWIYYNHQLAGI